VLFFNLKKRTSVTILFKQIMATIMKNKTNILYQGVINCLLCIIKRSRERVRCQTGTPYLRSCMKSPTRHRSRSHSPDYRGRERSLSPRCRGRNPSPAPYRERSLSRVCYDT